MIQAFKEIIENEFPFLLKSPFLAACSAGVDSVTLAQLCSKMKLNFGLVHCNFRLRGADSDADEQLVKELAAKLKVDFFSKTFPDFKQTIPAGFSLQMWARELRYNWFKELTKKGSREYILTAHHADDNLETFIINLSRGSGIKGLSGIPARNGIYIRPLLSFSKEEILRTAENEKWVWREDKSNAETFYLRNKIRHQIVPELKDLSPAFLSNFQNTLQFLKDHQKIASEAINNTKKKLFSAKEDGFSINLKELHDLNPAKTWLFELFDPYGFKEINNLEELLYAQSGKRLLSKSWVLHKDREQLLLIPRKTEKLLEKRYLISEAQELTEVPVKLVFEAVTSMKTSGKRTIFVDKETLNFPLVLRKWHRGDYFYPLKLGGRKKLSKFFKDQKFTAPEKKEQWLLVSNNKLVWVLGQRADERFKVTDSTLQIIKITWLS